MDYYQILGVSREASQTEIRNAYRKLAKLYHPDRNPSAEAKNAILLVNEAYETLSDPGKRLQYDQPVYSSEIKNTQEDLRQAQRRENYRRWQETERIKREEFEGYKLEVLNQFKKYNMVLVIWALLMVLDEYIIPPRVIQEEVLLSKAIRVPSGRRASQIVHVAQTESYVMGIPRIAVEKSVGGKLQIESSRILNVPLRVSTPDGDTFAVSRNIYAFIAPMPLLLLLFAALVYFVKEPNNWATLVISLEGVAIVLIVVLWLISVGDRNAF
jgi:DnaJ-domain-containing protein 1